MYVYGCVFCVCVCACVYVYVCAYTLNLATLHRKSEHTDPYHQSENILEA